MEEEAPDAAQTIYPLTVEISALTDTVHQHLASGDLTPDHLLEHATVSKTERLYVPAIEFFGAYEAQWTASFGYDRTEHYTDYETRTVNGHSRQVAVSKTKTVTDWRPVNGTDTGKFYVTAYAGTRLTSPVLDVTPLVEQQIASAAVPFDSSYLTGVEFEDFAHPETDVYQNRGRPQVNQIIDRNVEKHGQGDHQKDWHWTADISKRSSTVLVPVCHAVYEFEGKEYNVWVSGVDTSRLIADPLPVDQDRKKAIQFGFIPAAVAFAASALAIFKFDAAWTFPLVVLAVAGGLGYWRKKSIIDFSLKLRRVLLASKQAASANIAGMSADEQSGVIESVKRPEKPWIAKTSNDWWLLPVVSLIAAVAPFFQVMGPFNSNFQSSSVPQQVEQAPVAVSPPIQVQQQPEAPANPGVASVYPRCAGSTELQKCEEEERNLASETPQQRIERQQRLEEERSRAAAEVNGTSSASSSQSSTVSEAKPQSTTSPDTQVDQRVVQLRKALESSRANNWAAVDEAIMSIKSQAQAIPQGDRKASRAANSEGLTLLKTGDFMGAIEAFIRGANSDPADIEVRNNLGYALLKAHKNTEAASILTALLAQVPDRTSAWTNFSESMVANPNVSTAALKIGVRFSANREKTLGFLRQLADNHPNEQYRPIIQNVLNEFNLIPSGPLR